MISLIVYGRNDAHGYNLHRRAALSLNCLAEVLSDDDDEIVFVDYNTPDELPTFVEALSDTLTAHCLSRLRVLRVPAALHRERFRAVTHLPALEPVCRNAAARRTNPANRWLLSTNTDMILVSHSEISLSDVAQDLANGFYGLPRFELPEWLWERLPRSDPRSAISEVGRLGPRLHLDEPTLNHEWVRFDAPGDFQLCLREDYFAVDGCDERMLLGWHVDSNLSRRLLLHRGSIESLEDAFAGYHCNHSRTPTIYHGSERIANDLTRFFLTVDRSDLPDQRDTWGLIDARLEEVAVVPPAGVHFADAIASAIPAGTHERVSSNPFESRFDLTYDSAHVLAHVSDSIMVSGQHVTVGYIGANPVLRDMIGHVVREASRDGSPRSFVAADPGEIDAFAESADLFIVDLGLDASLATDPPDDEEAQIPDFPESLRPVAVAFERLVHRERTRLKRGMHPRRFLLVNSTTAYVDSFVLSNLDCSGTTAHSHVRRATVKLVPISKTDVLRGVRWADRIKSPPQPLQLRVGESASFAELEDFGGFGQGWWLPDPSGIWTCGPRAVLTLACGDVPAWARPVLELTFDRIGVRRGRPVEIGLLIDETRVETRVMTGGTCPAKWRVPIPQHALAKRVFGVALEVEGHGEWSDDTQLGVHVQSLGVDAGLLPTALRDWLDDVDEALVPFVRRLRHRSSRAPRQAALRLQRRRASGT